VRCGAASRGEQALLPSRLRKESGEGLFRLMPGIDMPSPNPSRKREGDTPIDNPVKTRNIPLGVASMGRMLMLKSILAAGTAMALLAPLPAAAEEPIMKLAGMLRCAAVYQVTSEKAPKDSEAQLTAGRHFLQYYMIMLGMAELDPADTFDAKGLKTLFEAENAIADSDELLARIDGKTDVFAADIATCTAFRNSQPQLFATADRTIDAMAKAQAGATQ